MFVEMVDDEERDLSWWSLLYAQKRELEAI